MRVPIECVPDPDVPDCGNVFVSVAAGDWTTRAVVDTGSPSTMLIDVPPSARFVGRTEASGLFGAESVTEWEVDELRIGSLSAGPLTVQRVASAVGRHPVVGLDLGRGKLTRH